MQFRIWLWLLIPFLIGLIVSPSLKLFIRDETWLGICWWGTIALVSIAAFALKISKPRPENSKDVTSSIDQGLMAAGGSFLAFFAGAAFEGAVLFIIWAAILHHPPSHS